MLPEFCLFLDENHCNNQHLRSVLREHSVPFESCLDHFAHGTADTEWLPHVGANGWVLLTTDKHIRTRTIEREAVQAHSVRMFYFSKNNMSGRQLAAAIKKALPEMRRIFENNTPPYFAAITREGNVHLRKQAAGDSPS